jgi:hypothetical protein
MESPKTQEQKVIVNHDDVLIIPDFDRTHVVINDIPPRFQWDGNNGYCGEVAMISAGLYYGQYLSQYDVRLLASGSDGIEGDQSQQLLLGEKNVVTAAEALRLKFETLTSQDSRSFMQWVKHRVASGYPVIIGVLNNVNKLGENPPGDPEYDHIVPVIGFGSNEALTENFDPTDKILISDNGLFYPGNDPVPPDDVTYYYEYEMQHFFSDRENANNPKGNLYSLLELPKYEAPGGKCNYAIALMGIMGQEETFPVRIQTDLNYEAPPIVDGSSVRPSPISLVLTITVSGLTAGTDYNLHHYNEAKDVPLKNFNAHPGQRVQKINISSGTSFTTTLSIKSSDKVFLRAVLA